MRATPPLEQPPASGSPAASSSTCAVRRGFGIIEVIVALVIFAIGALGAAALTAHAARTVTVAQREEMMVLHATMLLDSLLADPAATAGARSAAAATYRWQISSDGSGRRVRVEATAGGSSDTTRLEAHRPALPGVIGR